MVNGGNEQLSLRLHTARESMRLLYGLLCSFCVPNAICFESFGGNRVGRLLPCVSSKTLVSVHQHFFERIDMISGRLVLVLCPFRDIQ